MINPGNLQRLSTPVRIAPDVRFACIVVRARRLLAKWPLFAADLVVVVSAFVAAYLLRFDFALGDEEILATLAQLPLVVASQLGALVLTGAHRYVWRYIGMTELRTFPLAASLALLPVLAARFGLGEQYQQIRVPLSIALLDAGLAFGGLLSIRVLRRALYERSERKRARRRVASHRKRVLLVGAGRGGVLAAREILSRGDADLDIAGFVDDDPAKHGAVIQGVEVLGATRDIPDLARRLAVDHVVITIAQASRREIRRIMAICERASLKVRIVPGLYEILQGRVRVSRIRDLQVEDLLGRAPVRLDEAAVRGFLSGKVVMVTGAGGSIGSELARQIARFTPARLLLVERAECALFEIERELRDLWPELNLDALVADVGDRSRMQRIFATYRVEAVLHAAAHKHVPMMEYCPSEAVRNNVLATRTLGELAGEHCVETFVLISTDKAVNPSSVMGASKRVAELVIQDLDREYETRYLAVRFGNVIGSAGSVVQIFRSQISKGGPVTVTHPDMSRYFMTIPEAAQLVLQGSTLGKGAEIFVLDMGEPANILDLATDTITLSGLRPFDDIEIVFTGIRPGEKLYEELDTTDERVERTAHPYIFVGKIREYSSAEVRSALDRLAEYADAGDDVGIRRTLGELLPEAHVAPENPAARSQPPAGRSIAMRKAAGSP